MANVFEMLSMKGKVCVATAAGSGLGKAMVQALAQAGADIVIGELDVELAKQAAEEIEKECGVKVLAVKCDASKPEDTQALIDITVETFGKVDVLLNNAGITIHCPAEDVTYEDWTKVIDLNLTGAFFCAQAAGRQMIKQGYGVIVNTSSMSGVIVNDPQGQASYNSSKAGIIHMTKTLACEWAKYGIRVNAICPGYMQTAMTKPIFDRGGEMVERWMSMSPFGRPGTPEELMGIALYYASDASSFTSGTAICIDGAYCCW